LIELAFPLKPVKRHSEFVDEDRLSSADRTPVAATLMTRQRLMLVGCRHLLGQGLYAE